MHQSTVQLGSVPQLTQKQLSHSLLAHSRPTSRASVDSDIPSWTALSTANASDEENGLHPESHTTTPEPPYTSGHTQAVNDTISSQTKQSSLLQWPSLNQMLPRTSATSVRKRRPSQMTDTMVVSGEQPRLKKAKHTASLGSTGVRLQVSGGSSAVTPESMRRENLIADRPTQPDRPSTEHTSRITLATQTERIHHIGTEATPKPSFFPMVQAATSHIATRPSRPPKPLPSITENSGAEEWERVDGALQTHVASLRVLPSFAQLPPQHADGDVSRARMHVLLRLPDLGKESKGKGRAQSGWTTPRWSNVGEFKARLDSMYGPGDINRGLGRGPKNTKTQNAETNDAGIGLDPGVVQGTMLTEDEEDPDASLGGVRRGRLGNPSPERENRASRRHSTSNHSSEIA